MNNQPDLPLTRRPATADDLDLIYTILRETMRSHVEQTWGPWDEADQRRRFAQTRPEGHAILELDGQPVGCLCVTKSQADVYLERLSILPPFQNRGLGTQILKDLLEMADSEHLPVRLRVLRVNPARRLYERHDFKVVEENETHYTMIRRAK